MPFCAKMSKMLKLAIYEIGLKILKFTAPHFFFKKCLPWPFPIEKKCGAVPL